MDKKKIAKQIQKVWQKAKATDSDCHDEVTEWLEDNGHLTDYQRGYFNAKLEEIGNCLSSENEDWIFEVKKIIVYL